MSYLIEVGPLLLNMKTRQAKIHDNYVELTRREFQLIRYMFEHAGEVLSREKLFLHVWGGSTMLDTRTIDTHVSNLRRKLKVDLDAGFELATVYGQGYKLNYINAE